MGDSCLVQAGPQGPALPLVRVTAPIQVTSEGLSVTGAQLLEADRQPKPVCKAKAGLPQAVPFLPPKCSTLKHFGCVLQLHLTLGV